MVRPVLAIPIAILLCFACSSQAEYAPCTEGARIRHNEGFAEVLVCEKSIWKVIDTLGPIGVGATVSEVIRRRSTRLLVVNEVKDLSADSASVVVRVYDAASGTELLRAYSMNSATVNDINSDGVLELILYENVLGFDSLLLAMTGWPTIIELSDPISIGVLSGYPSLRTRLIQESVKVKAMLEAACIDGGMIDPMCGATNDIQRLGLFIDVLGGNKVED